MDKKPKEIKKSHMVVIYPSHARKLERAGQKLPKSKGRLNLSGGIEVAAELLSDEVKK